MQYTYTTIISKKDSTFYAKIPDIDSCITTGKSLQEAISQITDALNLCLTVLEDEGVVPKRPTPKIFLYLFGQIQMNTERLILHSEKKLYKGGPLCPNPSNPKPISRPSKPSA